MSNSIVGILSLLFGILGFFTAHWYFGVLFIIVAIILGIIALTDYLAYKWSAIIGLAFSGLGVALLIYTLISDINSNKLIIYYNSGDKVYLSNYKQIDVALKEVENFNFDDGMQQEWQDEKVIDGFKTERETAGRVLYQDENIIITYDGISEGSWGGGYDINLIVENLSQRTLTIQCGETSINGYMVDPICSIEVAPGKKSRNEISIMGKDAESIPMNMVENVETKFHIFDFDDIFDSSYDTENIIIR